MRRFFKWLMMSLGLGFMLLVLLPMAVWVGTALFSKPVVAKNSILRVVLDGPMPEMPRLNWMSLVNRQGHVSLRGLTDGIRQAASDDRVVGLVLEIRQPEIGLAQMTDIADAVKVFQDASKWTMAYLETAEGYMGQADRTYALASCAERIVLSPSGDVNLTGLKAEVPFVKETLRRLKIQPYVEQRYEYKNFANTFTQEGFTPAHRLALKGVLDDLQSVLLDHIAQRRHVSPQQIRRWVEKAPFSAQEALEYKLVDQLGYWDDVLTHAQKTAGRQKPFLSMATYVGAPPPPRPPPKCTCRLDLWYRAYPSGRKQQRSLQRPGRHGSCYLNPSLPSCQK